METNELKKKKKQALKYLEKYKVLKAEVENSCTHPEEELINKEEYNSGSYSNRAYTELYTECMICGSKSETKVIEHSWYG